MTNDQRPEALVAYITRRVQTDIARHKFPPGSRLSASNLAGEYDVSHIPVREALSSMAAKGYIVHHRSRGFFTREVHREEIEDIYRWRQVLETEAYRAAVPKITDEDIARMRTILGEMQKLTQNEDRIRYMELNREFHFVVFQRAGSPILLQLLTYLWDISAPYVALDLIDSDHAQKDHLEQLELYEARDAEGIIKAMDEHRGFRLDMVAKSDIVTD
ncbi:GntR family transcriptional regulator [Saccharopolyspora gloriosae]|uniref:GntR family transcriptional regulator n=1 Tax=Saccharopolyspora gloriosae TaxID=455344 RepID=UPI001FB648F0|nr:GntR family transcriptional regulator [Saccharopolyspora gloriosae]